MWTTWFLGHLSGVLIVAPAVITALVREQQARNRRQLAELVLIGLLFAACSYLASMVDSAPLFFLFIPFIAWLAFRFSMVEVAMMNLAVAMVVVGLAVAGVGPLASLPLGQALFVLQTFACVVAVTGLALAVTVDQRRKSDLALRTMQENLEMLVRRRTEQLGKAVDALEHDAFIRERVQRESLAKEKQLEEAQHIAHLGSWEWNAVTNRMIMSKEMARIYGVSAEEQREHLDYTGYLKFIPPDECSVVAGIVQTALSTRQPFTYEHHVVRPDGETRFLRCSGRVELNRAGTPVRLFGTAHDRTEERLLETRLSETEELYRKLVELSPDAIYLLHNGKYAFSNAAGLKLAGAVDTSELIGQKFHKFIAHGSRGPVEEALQELMFSGQPASVEGKVARLDNAVIDIELAAARFSIKGTQDILVVARDISERKKSERKIHHLAHHDVLTGLGNRLLFKERLEHAIFKSHRTGKVLAVLFVDLDRFKSINDTAGHEAGDQVLRECAQRLRNCLRESDTIARAGGDEFLILIDSFTEPLNVPAVVEKILRAVRQPFHVEEKVYEIDASIGVSVCPDDGDSVEMLIRHADTAMYRAKKEGDSHYRYYLPSMTQQSIDRYAIESALRHALERGEMELYFQPKFSLSSRSVCGAEALIRWHHPTEGLLLPERFVPVAEDMGVIADIGLWAIREVCRHTREWRQQGMRDVRIAVNLAYSQFADKAFFSKTERLLQDFGVDPGALELEITETMVMQHAERLMSTLHQLKRLGIHLSIDDFGTGYSSLAYLKRLPVDSVKVDRSFIKDLPGDNEDAAITHAVLALVHSLNRSVIAEGVETRAQLDFLIDNGCDEVQGYYFSPALPEKEFREFMIKEMASPFADAEAW
jgi:diguanylate cyclase (GGDEF)-like protein/PAS domain S-box-containing protein